MKLVCAWCGATMDRPQCSQSPEPITSHGMCAACSEVLAMQDAGASIEQYLDSIPIPVVMIDDRAAIVTMNSRACDTLGKSCDRAMTPLAGKVFDCVHSSSEKGCGRTIHCAGCTIRRSITTTFHTGMSQISVPATLSVTSQDDISAAILAVTTVRIGGLVVLRID